MQPFRTRPRPSAPATWKARLIGILLRLLLFTHPEGAGFGKSREGPRAGGSFRPDPAGFAAEPDAVVGLDDRHSASAPTCDGAPPGLGRPARARAVPGSAGRGRPRAAHRRSTSRRSARSSAGTGDSASRAHRLKTASSRAPEAHAAGAAPSDQGERAARRAALGPRESPSAASLPAEPAEEGAGPRAREPVPDARRARPARAGAADRARSAALARARRAPRGRRVLLDPALAGQPGLDPRVRVRLAHHVEPVADVVLRAHARAPSRSGPGTPCRRSRTTAAAREVLAVRLLLLEEELGQGIAVRPGTRPARACSGSLVCRWPHRRVESPARSRRLSSARRARETDDPRVDPDGGKARHSSRSASSSERGRPLRAARSRGRDEHRAVERQRRAARPSHAGRSASTLEVGRVRRDRERGRAAGGAASGRPRPGRPASPPTRRAGPGARRQEPGPEPVEQRSRKRARRGPRSRPGAPGALRPRSGQAAGRPRSTSADRRSA